MCKLDPAQPWSPAWSLWAAQRGPAALSDCRVQSARCGSGLGLGRGGGTYLHIEAVLPEWAPLYVGAACHPDTSLIVMATHDGYA